MSDDFLGYLLSGAALLLFTGTILVTKVASNRLNLSLGFLIATFTNVVFAAFALMVQLSLLSDDLQWNANAFVLFAAAGGFATYLGRWFFYESVVRFGPAKASIFQVSSPLFTALMAWALLGEQVTIWVAMGIVMTIVGLILVSYKPGLISSRDAAVASAAPMHVAGKKMTRQRLLESVFLLGVGSSMAYAIGNVLRGTAVRSWPEPIVGALTGAVFGLALHLAFSADKRGLWSRLRAADRSGLWLYALIGVGNISGQICVIGAMRYIPLSVATLVTLCTPILVFPLSHMLFKNQDRITVTTLLGAAVTLSGIFIIVLR